MSLIERGAAAPDQEAGHQEQRGRRDAVVEHVEDRAGAALAGEHEDAQHDEAEVADTRCRRSAAACRPGRSRPARRTRCEISGEHDHHRRRPAARPRGSSPRQKRSIPKVPILSRMQTSSTLVPVVACSVVSGSQVCTGNSGALTANAMKKPTNSQRLRVGVDVDAAAGRVKRYDGVPRLGGHDVQADHRGQHHQAAGQLVDQELHRGRATARSPPKPPTRKYAGISVASNTT